MRSAYTLFIEPKEWRWVVTISFTLALLAFIPFFVISYQGFTNKENIVFTGTTYDTLNVAGDLVYLDSASRGDWLGHYRHTPEAHNGVFMDVILLILGNLSRLSGLSSVIIYHIFRICAAAFMYLCLYQLAVSIWSKVRTRRIFFLLSAMGSGFGWFLSAFWHDAPYLDTTMPSAFPFFSTLSSVHIPLAIACLALLASVIVTVMRPDETAIPTVSNGGTMVFLLGLVLVQLYPVAFLPIAIAFSLNIILGWTADRQINRPQLSWLLWFIVPSLPILLYYVLFLQNDPITALIWQQNMITKPPTIDVFLLSYGVIFILALPGLYRAIRRFERDGNQFMIIWFMTIIALIFLPTGVQLNFAVGLIIPMTYFATRGIEDFWLRKIRARYWIPVAVSVLLLSSMSHIFLWAKPLFTDESNNNMVMLSPEYHDVFRWLGQQNIDEPLILASPEVSLWLPTRLDVRVVYGHPVFTADATIKHQAVVEWYQSAECDLGLLDGVVRVEGTEPYRVDYVIDGPLERAIGQSPCLDQLTLVANLGGVSIYQYDR
jgi:hypothetical protein